MSDVPESQRGQGKFETIAAAGTAILVLALLLGGMWYFFFSAPAAPPAITKQADPDPLPASPAAVAQKTESIPQKPAAVERSPEPAKPTVVEATPVATVQAANPAGFTDYTKLLPNQAVVINVNRSWQFMKWADCAYPQGDNFHNEFVDGKMVFTCNDPHTMMLWGTNLGASIPLKKYPIVKVRYRSSAPMDTIAWYHMWMDDGTGPMGGGVSPFELKDAIGDGQEHEMSFDVRPRLKGDRCTNFRVSLAPADQPVKYELIALWFEAAPDAPLEPLKEDAPIPVLVLGADGKGLAGATVAGDTDRINFSRSVVTNADGRANLTLIVTDNGQHRLDASAPGMPTVGRMFTRKFNSKPDEVMEFRLRGPRKATTAPNATIVPPKSE